MEIVDQQSKNLLIRINCEEVIAINNALNESLEIEEWEFETRMGITREKVIALLAAFRAFNISLD
jgi:hypothetical protein